MKTTIQIDVETKKQLEELKIYPKEPFSSVIKRIIKLKIDEEPLSKETIRKIEIALRNIKEGKVYTTKEVKKRLGIE